MFKILFVMFTSLISMHAFAVGGTVVGEGMDNARCVFTQVAGFCECKDADCVCGSLSPGAACYEKNGAVGKIKIMPTRASTPAKK